MAGFLKHAAVMVGCGTMAYLVVKGNSRKQYRDIFMTSEHFLKSVNLLRGYQPAVKYLGEPIEAGVDLRDGYTAVSELDAQLTVPVRGSRNVGTMYTKCSRPTSDDNWVVDKLDFKKSTNDQQWTFYRNKNKDIDTDSGVK